MFIKKFISLFLIFSFNLYSDDTETQSFPGLISSDVFNMGNGMEMHIERRKTCNQGTVPKHFHPAAGTLVYVLDGVSQSKSTGKWKSYSNNEPYVSCFGPLFTNAVQSPNPPNSSNAFPNNISTN